MIDEQRALAFNRQRIHGWARLLERGRVVREHGHESQQLAFFDEQTRLIEIGLGERIIVSWEVIEWLRSRGLML